MKWIDTLKQSWLKSQEEKLAKEYSEQLGELHERLNSDFKKIIDEAEESKRISLSKVKAQQEEVDWLSSKLLDRKTELEKSNQELREHIRIIEAKASPSNVWSEAFSLGFSKAWDMMVPVMTGGIENIKKTVRDITIEEILSANPVLKSSNELATKKILFETKLAQSTSDQDKQKYQNYIEALTWATNGNDKKTN